MTTATELNTETKAVLKSVKNLMDSFIRNRQWDEEFLNEIKAYRRSYGDNFAQQWVRGQLHEEFCGSVCGSQPAFAYIDTAVELLLTRVNWVSVSQYVLTRLRGG